MIAKGKQREREMEKKIVKKKKGETERRSVRLGQKLKRAGKEEEKDK
jgi:hypothetical protein